MFCGERMKRTCLASNNAAVLDLQVSCDGQHAHKPWTVQDGRFDTATEAEYTPQLAKALATAIMLSLVDDKLALQFAVLSKKLKLSYFSATGSQIQPAQALPHLVPEFACLLLLSNIPEDQQFAVDSHSNTIHCLQLRINGEQLVLPFASKQLRLTLHKGGEISQPSYEFFRVQSLVELGDLHQRLDRHHTWTLRTAFTRCSSAQVIQLCNDSPGFQLCDRVFGIKWSEEQFIQQALEVGHPFDNFSGVDSAVKDACHFIAASSSSAVVVHRISICMVGLPS